MDSENPYMMENTPQEEERVKGIAARRHDEEAQKFVGSVRDAILRAKAMYYDPVAQQRRIDAERAAFREHQRIIDELVQQNQRQQEA